MEEVSGPMEAPDMQRAEVKETDIFPRILVVRHAESIANTKGIFQGQTHDTDLSELGVRQARALARSIIGGQRIKKIVSSPLRRTYQTALEISKVCDCQIEVRSEIMETNHGVWEGKSKNWILANYKELYELWMQEPSKVTFPEGESFLDTVDRVNRFVDNYVNGESTLVVTHDNIVRIMVAVSKGDLIDKIWDYDIHPAALNYFEVNRMGGENKLRLLKLNETEHLEGAMADLGKHAL